MIVFGSGAETLDLGVAANQPCEICEKERPFHIYLHYSYAHAYFLFRAVTEKKYLMLCEICNRGWELDQDKVEESLAANPIPFMDRHGCAVGIAAVVGFIVCVAVAERLTR